MIAGNSHAWHLTVLIIIAIIAANLRLGQVQEMSRTSPLCLRVELALMSITHLEVT